MTIKTPDGIVKVEKVNHNTIKVTDFNNVEKEMFISEFQKVLKYLEKEYSINIDKYQILGDNWWQKLKD